MLIVRYRCAARDGNLTTKAEPIAAEESRLILTALRDTKWDGPAAELIYAPPVFAMLGLTAADGWQQPDNFDKFPAAAKDWLAKRADRYRIQRLVPQD